MNNFMIGIMGLILTLGVYFMASKMYFVLSNPFTLPILTSTIVIVVLLLVTHISYETYMVGGQWIDRLLGPAVVALGYPLYKQWPTLKKYLWNIISSVTVGAIIGVITGILLAKWFDLDDFIMYSMVPKNTTTPVAMSIAETIGGVPSMTAVFVMIAGIGGAVMGPIVMKWGRIQHYLGKGIGMGSASHAIGTARAMKNSEEEGTVSTVAMIVCAIVLSLIAPLSVKIFL
ncbi:hypothetical protein N784_10355 [Pontibacillus litoralis JSM 072002]|uniref:LrgB n=2 Tax=Pontibacillus TaxID=289201 RepID=A0A0A5HWX7_9BACI|nr:LrgB family protein [Pontibacillus litoralis]KGX88137.1 hypothetical protein N784_10355 [Pontibacillus litoralis JSM 072002]